MDPDQPCSSKQAEEQCEFTDRIDDCAKKYNLSFANVKDIIKHILHTPESISFLNTLESNQRITRAKHKQVEDKLNTKIDIKLKPIEILVGDSDDEDEDVDYRPEEEEDSQDLSEEDIETEDAATDHQGSTLSSPPKYTYQSPIYNEFIQGVYTEHDGEWNNFENTRNSMSEDDDPDFDPGMNLFNEEYDPVRRNKDTYITQDEHHALYADAFDAEEDPFFSSFRLSSGSRMNLDVPLASPERAKSMETTKNPTPIKERQRNEYEPPMKKSKSNSHRNFTEEMENSNQNQRNGIQNENLKNRNLEESHSQEDQRAEGQLHDPLANSWSLKMRHKEMAKFTFEEIKILQIQMEKHIQLLTQCIITSKYDSTLVKPRNEAIKMVAELQNKQGSSQNFSIFNCKNLADSIDSINDAENLTMEGMPKDIKWDLVTEKLIVTHLHPTTAYSLSQSKALLYPSILVTQGPAPTLLATPTNFSAPEQKLLAFGLYELSKFKASTTNGSKYHLISQHFCPNKTQSKLKNFVKNVNAGAQTNPIHKLILDCRRGVFNYEFKEEEDSMEEVPAKWMYVKRIPSWLQIIQAALNNQEKFIKAQPSLPLPVQPTPFISVSSTEESYESCSLKAETVKISASELQTLRLQFIKHVQLIAQTVISSHKNPNLVAARNKAINMIEEINTNIDRLMFIDYKQFTEVVQACNDLETFNVNNYQELRIAGERQNLEKELSITNWPLSSAFILANCPGIKFPDLLPINNPVQSSVQSTQSFLPSEKLLLSLALYQFSHIPEASTKEFNYKFKWIIDNFLPNKFIKSIQNFINQVNANQTTNVPDINAILLKAIKGQWCGKVNLNISTALEGGTLQWKNVAVPHWVKVIQEHCERYSKLVPPQPQLQISHPLSNVVEVTEAFIPIGDGNYLQVTGEQLQQIMAQQDQQIIFHNLNDQLQPTHEVVVEQSHQVEEGHVQIVEQDHHVEEVVLVEDHVEEEIVVDDQVHQVEEGHVQIVEQGNQGEKVVLVEKEDLQVEVVFVEEEIHQVKEVGLVEDRGHQVEEGHVQQVEQGLQVEEEVGPVEEQDHQVEVVLVEEEVYQVEERHVQIEEQNQQVQEVGLLDEQVHQVDGVVQVEDPVHQGHNERHQVEQGHQDKECHQVAEVVLVEAQAHLQNQPDTSGTLTNRKGHSSSRKQTSPKHIDNVRKVGSHQNQGKGGKGKEIGSGGKDSSPSKSKSTPRSTPNKKHSGNPPGSTTLSFSHSNGPLESESRPDRSNISVDISHFFPMDLSLSSSCPFKSSNETNQSDTSLMAAELEQQLHQGQSKQSQQPSESHSKQHEGFGQLQQHSQPSCSKNLFSLSNFSFDGNSFQNDPNQDGMEMESTDKNSEVSEKESESINDDDSLFKRPSLNFPFKSSAGKKKILELNAYKSSDGLSNDVVYYGSPVKVLSKNSRRHEQYQRSLQNFRDKLTIETWSKLAVETVKQLMRQKLFMHSAIFDEILEIIVDGKNSTEKLEALKILIPNQKDLIACISALFNEEQLEKKERLDPLRMNYKNALDMLLNINIYFSGQVNSTTKKKLVEMVCEHSKNEPNLRLEMRKALAGRHELLWLRLKKHFTDELFMENVEHQKFEKISISTFNNLTAKKGKNQDQVTASNNRSEFLDLTMTKPKTTFKPHLRVHNSHFQMKKKNSDGEDEYIYVNVNKRADKIKEIQERVNGKYIGYEDLKKFTIDDDRDLFEFRKICKNDRERTAEMFNEKRKSKDLEPFTPDLIKLRLQYLIDLMQELYKEKMARAQAQSRSTA